MAAILATNTVQVARFADALYNIQLGSSTMNQVLSDIAANNGVANTLNAYFVASFGKMTSDAVADTLIANLGITDGADIAKDYVIAQLEAVPMAQRGAVVNDILSGFATLSSDATFGSAATAWNTQMTTAVNYAADSANTADVTTGTTSATVGKTFTLTTSIDNVTGTASDDIILSDSGSVSAADQVEGGAGTDTLKIYSNGTTILPSLSNVENVYIKDTNGMDDLNIATVAGITSLEFDSTATQAAAKNLITVTTGQTLKLTKVTDGSAGTDSANDSGELEIASASGVTSLSITLSDVGDSAATADLDIDVAGTGVATLAITSTGDTNYAELLNTGTALRTITVAGDKMLSAANGALASVTTIDASASTGGVKLNITGSTGDVTLTGGTGDDTFVVGADLDTMDVINGGEGTDTVSISDATLTASTLAAVKGANALTAVEVLGVSAATTITIDASIFTAINSFSNTAAVTGTAGSGSATAAKDGVNFTFEAGDTFIVGANITGGAASASGDGVASVGGDALNLAAKVNSGTDTVTIKFAKGAATTLTGGAGAADSGDGAETGGDAIDVSTVEIINIVTASADDVVTLTGGASGSAGISDGASITVGANATINLSGAGNVNLGTVATQGAAVDDLTINGTDMTGKLTVTTGAGNDIIKGGSKVDTITAGTGTNTVTGNGGADTFNFAIGTSTSTALTTITDFVMGAGNDVIDVTGKTATYEAITSANATAIAADTSLADALTQAFTQLIANEATAFVYSGAVYVVFEDGSNAGYAAAEDLVVKLSGLTSTTAFDATNIG